jgi:hypothetical protein
MTWLTSTSGKLMIFRQYPTRRPSWIDDCCHFEFKMAAILKDIDPNFTLAMRNCISPTLKLIPLHNLGVKLTFLYKKPYLHMLIR